MEGSAPPTAERAEAAVTLGALFFGFLRCAFGGIGGGLFASTRRVIVAERRWLSDAEFVDTLSLCQLMPGPNFANLAICTGARFRGAFGAAAAFSGLCAIPMAIALSLGSLYLRWSHLAVAQRTLGGVSAAAAGLVIATGIKMLLPYRRSPATLIFAALAFAGIVAARLPLPIVLLGLAPFSIAAGMIGGGRPR
jgi:chromate transporter